MQTERRCVQRKTSRRISYIEFEAGSGAIILDASEKGLGFRAAAALQQLGPSRIRIWTSPRPEERIEITGDVVWTNSSNQTGGLRFIETGADSCNQIRKWLWQPGELEVAPQFQEFPWPARSAEKLPEVRRETPHNANLVRSPVASQAKNEVDEALGLPPIPALTSPLPSNSPGQSQDSQASRRGLAYRLATGFLIGVLAWALVVLFEMFRPEVGASLIHLGEKITGSGPPRQSSSPLPMPSSTPVPAHLSPSTEAKPDVLQKEPSMDSTMPPDSSRQVTSRGPNLAIPRKKEAADRSAYPLSPNSAQDRRAEVTRLWSAVASGNASAEVDLARLYLRGDGVPQNCEQAKVLLNAAANGGSAEARQELKKLRTSGCQ